MIFSHPIPTRARHPLAWLAALALVLSACGAGDDDADTTTTVDTEVTTTETSGDASTTETTDTDSTTETTDTDSTTSETTATDDTTSETTTAPSGETGELSLEPLTSEVLTSAGVEPVGCWFHEGETIDSDPVFFSGFDGAFFLVDGDLVQVDKPSGNSFGVEEGLVYTGQGYEVSFTSLGEPVESSIESTEQDATLDITPEDADTTTLEGILWCGA